MSLIGPDKLEPDQVGAGNKIYSWYHDYRWHQQIFRLLGYAGSGKTTIIEHVLNQLGLPMESVRFGTYTAKAAHVMRQLSSVPCQTIHSMIYVPRPHSTKHINELQKEIDERKTAKMPFGDLERKLQELQKVDWDLNEASKLNGASLLICDECSMIPMKMAMDLLSFQVPILLVGDPGQLPPIDEDKCGFPDATPDVFLTKVHRQALDSPIINLATMARQGIKIPAGSYGEMVHVARRGDFDYSDEFFRFLLKLDQVIVGTNALRRYYNREMRRVQGFTSVLPTGPKEKIICTKNITGLPIFNGAFLTMSNVKPKSARVFTADITTEDGVQFPNMSCYAGNFLDHEQSDQKRKQQDFNILRSPKLLQADFGYAITCHKSQGSGFDRIAVIDDWPATNHDKWLYTAITRAAEGLLLLTRG